MAKIPNDKYYTSPELAKYVVDITHEIIGEENITEYLEPSAGSGVFLDYLDELNKSYLAYDIEPEDSKDRIVKQNYLELNLDYKKGRCVIGNPPFGRANTLSVRFYKKSIHICDYIVFILPISQYQNNIQMYEFDLIYSENLGVQNYSDRQIYCCLNIYKKNSSNGFNKKPNYKLKDVEIKEYRRGGKYKEVINYDYGMCMWGNGGCGKQVEFQGKYEK